MIRTTVPALAGAPEEIRAQVATLPRTIEAHDDRMASLPFMNAIETGGSATATGPLAFPFEVAAWNLERCLFPEATAALRSTIHGAGRVMSRTQAAGKRRWVKRDGRRVQEVVRPGAISRQMMMDWLAREGVELRGAGTDESPQAYRRLPAVLAEHAGSIRILHTLRPLGVAMAGEEVVDPYKD